MLRTHCSLNLLMAFIGVALAVHGCRPSTRWTDSGLPKLISDQALKTVGEDRWKEPGNSGHSAGSPGHGGGIFYKQSLHGTIRGASEAADQLLEQIRTETLAIIQQQGGVITGQGERRGDQQQYKSTFVTTQSGDPNDKTSRPLSGFELEYQWKNNYGLIDAYLFRTADDQVEIVMTCSEHRG